MKSHLVKKYTPAEWKRSLSTPCDIVNMSLGLFASFSLYPCTVWDYVCVCVCGVKRKRVRARARQREWDPAAICRFFGWACACNQLFIQASFEIIELTHLSDGSRRNAKRSRRKIPAAPDEPFLPSNSTVITPQQMGSRSFHFASQVRQMRPARSTRVVRLTDSRLPQSHDGAKERREPVVPGAQLISVMFCLINSQVQDWIQAAGWLVIISFWEKKALDKVLGSREQWSCWHMKDIYQMPWAVP